MKDSDSSGGLSESDYSEDSELSDENPKKSTPAKLKEEDKEANQRLEVFVEHF